MAVIGKLGTFDVDNCLNLAYNQMWADMAQGEADKLRAVAIA
jgi:hypothetical protein